MRQTLKFFPRSILITIYKSFVRPHVDYRDIIYDQTYKKLYQKLESIQYNACMALTAAISVLWKRKCIKNLVLSPSKFVVGAKNVTFLCKVRNIEHPKYLIILISVRRFLYLTKNAINISVLKKSQKAFHDFRSKQKCVWSNDFWCEKVCIFWKYIQYVIHWGKRQMWKKNYLNKVNGIKNALFFLSRVQTHDSFIFNLRFSYELKHKVRLSKTVGGIFHFRLHFVFLKVDIFV